MYVYINIRVCMYIHMYIHVGTYVYISEVGGSESGFSPPPYREIDFGFGCDCVACVRASERSCVREMILLWLGLGARICGGPVRSVRSGPPATLNKKFEQ